uniref:SLC13 family permease n=1 Tax=Neorhizobium sp. EC2-8 TaxID=3129230 RepID=UPI00310189C0
MTAVPRSVSMAAALVFGFSGPLIYAYSGHISGEDARIVGIVLTCVLLWAIGSVPGYLVSLLFFFLSVVLTNAPPSVIFSGFASSAFWLVLSGGVIGFALSESGLSRRIGNELAQRIGPSYPRALGAFALLTFALCLIMPSTFGRIAILVSIASGYCGAAGLEEGRPGRAGILLLVIVGSFEVAAGVLPANLPNIIMSGILEQTLGLHLNFSDYLWTFLPAGIVARTLLLAGVSFMMFPDTVTIEPATTEKTPFSPNEWRVLTLLAITLGLWLTDSLHRIAPGWVGLGYAITYLSTSSSEEIDRFAKTQKMDLLWFIAAIIGLTALVHTIDLRFLDVSRLTDYASSPFALYLLLTALSLTLCFTVTSNAAPALFSPSR